VNRAREEQLQRAGALLLRRSLAALRAQQRGPALPPQPPPADVAAYHRATPAERARAAVLLRGAGYARADVARGEELLRAGQLAAERPANDCTGDPDPVDAVTRARARSLLRGRG
jgi:hypothetical protein